MVRKNIIIVLSLLTLAAFGWGFGHFVEKFREARKEVSPQRTLIVYTYESFSGPLGPGKVIAKLYRRQTGIKIKFVSVGDAGLIISRLKLKAGMPADAVIGLDQYAIHQPHQEPLWRDFTDKAPAGKYLVENKFLTYDFAPMSFIYREKEIASFSQLKDLLKLDSKMSVPHPQLSTAGKQFLQWTIVEFGEKAFEDFWQVFFAKGHRFTSSWSAAYGQFVNGQQKVAFSYTSSLVYHRREKNEMQYKAMNFAKGQPYHFEYAAVPLTCRSCAEAESFLNFLLTDEAQIILRDRNYMFPVKTNLIEGTEYAKLERPLPLPELEPTEARRLQDELLEKMTKAGFLN